MGTIQAIFLTSFYLGGSIAILGINPIEVYHRREMLIGGPTDAELMADEKDIETAVEGMNLGDAVVLRAFKSMGLSEKTMVQIEKDLRIQQRALNEGAPPVESELKTDANATKWLL